MGGQQSIGNQCVIFQETGPFFYLVYRPNEILVDSSLVQFSGLDSTAELQRQLAAVDVNKLPDYTEKLGSALGGLAAVPNAVGLGALVISIILELVLGKQQTSTEDMLRRVFAEEKASEIRDLMNEYIKRLTINLRQPQLQLEDTRRIEVLLSAQLTRLKNSILVDGHMSWRAVNHWVNGAAFHIQMLIHQARLENGDEFRAIAAVDLYQQELNQLNSKYRFHVRDSKRYVFSICDSRPQCNMELDGPRQYLQRIRGDAQALIKQTNGFNVVSS